MKGENSIERAERMIKDLDQEIEFLRGCCIDAVEHYDEVAKELRIAKKAADDLHEQKMDAIYTKMALMEFIQNGGGLDMFVD